MMLTNLHSDRWNLVWLTSFLWGSLLCVAIFPAQSNDDQTQAQEEPYVDALIDPNKPEDTYEDYQAEFFKEKSIFHSIELKYLHDRPSGSSAANRYAGIAYSAVTSTENFGDLYVDIVALEESNATRNQNSTNNRNDADNDGIARWLIRQTRFPVTENVYADNYLGIHRPGFQTRFGNNFVSRRFNSLSPEIEGFTSQLHRGFSRLGVSAGNIGRNRGQLFPGFVDQNVDLVRLQGQHAVKHHLFTGDLWQTSEEDSQNSDQPGMEGFRATIDSLLPNNWRSSISAVSSDNRQAYLATLEQRGKLFRQDIGAYFYDPNIYWIDRLLSNDNRGAFYRFSDKKRIFSYGGSAEVRQDGLEVKQNQKDTTLITANASYRASRNNRISSFLSLRDVDATADGRSFEEYYVRAFTNFRHDNNSSSTLGVTQREKFFDNSVSDSTSQSIYYSQTRELNNDSVLDFSLESRQEEIGSRKSDSYYAEAGWQKELRNGQSFSLQVGHQTTLSSRSRNSDGWSGNLNHYWPISNRLSLGTRIGYNRTVYELDDEADRIDQLVTDFGFENDGLIENEISAWSALLTLKFSTGGLGRSRILAANPNKIGSGQVTGSIFIDENQDGIRQSFEKGISGVEVFLDSIYPMLTDADGKFVYPSVGLGNHHIFVDESRLPLPWMLQGEERQGLNVVLRETTTINIAVVNLPE